jgi:hypothetical protein
MAQGSYQGMVLSISVSRCIIWWPVFLWGPVMVLKLNARRLILATKSIYLNLNAEVEVADDEFKKSLR